VRKVKGGVNSKGYGWIWPRTWMAQALPFMCDSERPYKGTQLGGGGVTSGMTGPHLGAKLKSNVCIS